MATSYDPARQRSKTTMHAESLLRRYPQLSEQDLAELTSLIPSLRILDYGLITSDERLSGQLAAFNRDYGSEAEPAVAGLFAVLAISAMVAIFALWWLLT